MRFPFFGRGRTAAPPTETKASRTAALIAFETHGRAAWTPRDYAALAREGFAKNAVVYRSVRMIAEAAASVPWLLYEGDAEIDRHPLLALLAQPNRRQSGVAFREALVGHLMVSGNAYVEAVELDGRLRELHALRPDRIRIVPGSDGWPSAYEYTVGGRTVRFPGPGEGGLSPILHLSFFHPLNDHYGFAPIEAAATALDIHNAAGAWNKALLDNSARPSGALVYQAKEGGNLSQEQFERLKAELETSFIGAAHAGRPLLLEGGLDWKALSLSPKDMDFMAAKDGAAREIERISKALDEQKRAMDQHVLRGRRPPLGLEGPRSAVNLEHKAAFDAYVRGGNEDGLRAIERKSLAVGSDGGYVVPEETEREIGRRLASVSPIRGISGIRQVSGNVYKKPFAITGAATGWVGETAARPETAAPTLAELAFPAMELYAMPAATATLLDDAAVNIDEWLAEEVENAFATQEGTAFVTGDGTNKPKGFLAYDKVAQSSWAWEDIGYIVTGVSAGFAEDDPADGLIDLVYTLKSGYRQNATFVMNRKTQAAVRKLKDADGNYVWQPATIAGGTASLMNFPIAESEDMPDIAANSYSIAFGDFRRGYLVVDRVGIRVLRDPYSAKPYVLFYTTKRVGGGVQDFDAIKLLKFGTT